MDRTLTTIGRCDIWIMVQNLSRRNAFMESTSRSSSNHTPHMAPRRVILHLL